MGTDALKLELIEWLSKLEDESTIQYLKIIKEASDTSKDWWSDLSDYQKESIERGLKESKEGKLTSHQEVKSRYGL